MTEIDWDSVKAELSYIAVADHMGDVNNSLPDLCQALGLAEPVWDDEYDHYRFEWDTDDDDA